MANDCTYFGLFSIDDPVPGPFNSDDPVQRLVSVDDPVPNCMHVVVTFTKCVQWGNSIIITGSGWECQHVNCAIWKVKYLHISVLLGYFVIVFSVLYRVH